MLFRTCACRLAGTGLQHKSLDTTHRACVSSRKRVRSLQGEEAARQLTAQEEAAAERQRQRADEDTRWAELLHSISERTQQDIADLDVDAVREYGAMEEFECPLLFVEYDKVRLLMSCLPGPVRAGSVRCPDHWQFFVRIVKHVILLCLQARAGGKHSGVHSDALCMLASGGLCPASRCQLAGALLSGCRRTLRSLATSTLTSAITGSLATR